MINDNNLSGVYQNALNIMIQGNEFLSKIITSFIAEMPKNAKKIFLIIMVLMVNDLV